MATLIRKPRSSYSHSSPKSKNHILLIFLALLILIMSTISFYEATKNEILHLQSLIDQYQDHISQLKDESDARISQLQQALKESQAISLYQEEHIRKLKEDLTQHLLSSHALELNLLQEIEAHQDLYLQTQKKLHSYERQLLLFTREINHYKEQNKLIQNENVQIRAKYQELLLQKPQEALIQYMESELCHFKDVEDDFTNKLRDIQKLVESSAKAGELKALDVYFDDKLGTLNIVIQKSSNNSSVMNESQNDQSKQDFIEQGEGIKETSSNLGKHHKINEEKLKVSVNVNDVKPVKAPVQPPCERSKEVLQKENILSQNDGNKKGFKEFQEKQLHHQPNNIHGNVHQEGIASPFVHKDEVKKIQSQEGQEGQIEISEEKNLDQGLSDWSVGKNILSLFIGAGVFRLLTFLVFQV